MIYWAYISLTVAFTAGLVGFGGGIGAVSALAQVLFFVFLGLAGMIVVVKLTRDVQGDQSHTHSRRTD